MSNYLTVYRLIDLYDKEGLKGLKRVMLKRHFSPEDQFTGQVYEKMINRKFNEIDALMKNIKQLNL